MPTSPETDPASPDAEAAHDEADIPPEAGRRASIDPRTGAVHGSGAGAGGGNAGEDFDDDAGGGSDYPRTGADDESAAIERSR